MSGALIRGRVAVGTCALVLAAAAALTGCTGPAHTDGGGAPHPSPSGSAAGHPGTHQDAKSVIAREMATGIGAPAIAHGDGEIVSGSDKLDARAGVISVRAEKDQTVLRWRITLRDGSDGDDGTYAPTAQFSRAPLSDTRLVGLIVHADGGTKTFYPYTYVTQGQISKTGENSCLCSQTPDSWDATGDPLYAVMPPLPAGTTTVEVTMPGFDTITHVAVTDAR